MDCNKFRYSVPDYLSDELETGIQKDFDHHRISCQECSNELTLHSKLVNMIKEAPYSQVPETFSEIQSKFNKIKKERLVAKICIGISSVAAILIGMFIYLSGSTQNKGPEIIKKNDDGSEFKILAKDIAREVGLKHDEASKLEKVLIPEMLLEIACGKKELNGIVLGVTRGYLDDSTRIYFTFELSEKESRLITKLAELSANYFMDHYVSDQMAKLNIDNQQVKAAMKEMVVCKKSIRTANSKIIKLKITDENEARVFINLEREKIKASNTKMEESLDKLFNLLDFKKLLKFLPIFMESNNENNTQFMLAVPFNSNR